MIISVHFYNMSSGIVRKERQACVNRMHIIKHDFHIENIQYSVVFTFMYNNFIPILTYKKIGGIGNNNISTGNKTSYFLKNNRGLTFTFMYKNSIPTLTYN